MSSSKLPFKLTRVGRGAPSKASVWRFAAATLGGLAAGAGAAHLLYTQGHKYGLELRPKRPELVPPKTPTPEDYDVRDPGRGRLATRPEHIPHKGWMDILWRVGAAYFGDRVGFFAGGVTFFIVLSLFPTLAAFVTLYGLFADPADAWSRLQFLYSILPSNVAQFLGGEMQRLAANSSGQLTFTLVWTLLLSLWTANGGIKTLFYGLNVAYHEVEKRNLVRYNLICMAFTLSGLTAVLVSAGLVVGAPIVLSVFGLQENFGVFAWLRWPVLLVGYTGALTLIYRFGPCRQKARWRWLTPGAIFAAVLSVIVSFVFSWYLSTFVRLDSYGPLAAFMGFLLWIWFSVQIILMGAEVNAEIEHQTAIDTTTGAPRPLGERGALVADTIGPRRGSPAALDFTLKHAEAVADRLTKKKAKKRAS
ncbi:YihY/virulence factor BrkB family protein [Brevundimonas goettingensis]|uniref:YihY/virulence factor BrkB family protein n=1 Tax=Brevundimonas goettingensis TaxID=2774190 RepID=A0A975BZJ8_9CAUL|nr:YihY/virulence factor BrkB family protein [Brevundimonas goettingensis]QTC90963.1 YihY/virulence factor BrkB family protein [Brevundimonas goettingensis]